MPSNNPNPRVIRWSLSFLDALAITLTMHRQTHRQKYEPRYMRKINFPCVTWRRSIKAVI